MAWPPQIPPATRSNADPQRDTHPNDHNLIADALDELIDRAGGIKPTLIQSGEYGGVTSAGGTLNLNYQQAFSARPAVVATVRFPGTNTPGVVHLDEVTTTFTRFRIFLDGDQYVSSQAYVNWIAAGPV